jgi:predicted  nucleic acid-binding Zn-ribbon protein
MNSAFLKLASEDADLITEMKSAIKTMYEQAKKREMVYLAIEHNCKYLSILAEASHNERVIAVKDATETRKRINAM